MTLPEYWPLRHRLANWLSKRCLDLGVQLRRYAQQPPSRFSLWWKLRGVVDQAITRLRKAVEDAIERTEQRGEGGQLCKFGVHKWDDWYVCRTTEKSREVFSEEVCQAFDAARLRHRICLRCSKEEFS